MTIVYSNKNSASPITSVEFSPVPDGNFTFFTVDKSENKDMVKQWLAQAGQGIVAESLVGDKPVLTTRGDKTIDDMMTLLAAQGENLELEVRKIPFSERAWKTGATLAFIGQCMQLASSFLRPNRKADWSLRMLAIPNLIATAWIYLYGAQRSEDVHKLRAIKTGVNEALDDYLPDASALPSVDDKRADLRKTPENPPTFKEKLDDFLKRYSVVVGEIGLRYLGAVSLAFKFDNWPKAWNAYKTDGIKGAYLAGRTTTKGANKYTGENLTHYAGLLSLTGKTVALSAASPDPYNPDNPKPGSWGDRLRSLRENISFRLGGWMETLAFGAIAVDGFLNKKISFLPSKLDGEGNPLPDNTGWRKPIPDFISGIGGTLFTIRYIMRHWAPFGIKDLDMNEVYAHAVDGLAVMPQKALPDAVAKVAAEITDHFKEKKLNYGDVYTLLTDKLYHDRNVAVDLDHFTTEKPNAAYTAANPSRNPLDRVTVPVANHGERITTAGEIPLGMGAA